MYRVKIEKLTYVPENKYPSSETIYEQVLDTLDITTLVKFINSQQSNEKTA